MGFWNKLGKIALQAAPYVAAPFTAGTSLYFTPATQKLGQKWAESDAKKAAAKGLAPSKFDKYLGMASGVASLASGTGALGKFGSAAYSGAKAAGTAANAASAASKGKKVLDTAKTVSDWQNRLKQGGQIASMMAGSHPNAGMQNYDEPSIVGINGQQILGGGGGWQGQLAGLVGQALSNRGDEEVAPQAPRAPQVQDRPSSFQQRLNPIEMGRQAALQSQPWRAGYQTTISDDGNLFTNQMPAIYPQYQAPTQSESGGQQAPQNNYGDTLTPRYARKRNPAPEQEYD